jgi:hypothetical protein
MYLIGQQGARRIDLRLVAEEGALVGIMHPWVERFGHRQEEVRRLLGQTLLGADPAVKLPRAGQALEAVRTLSAPR